MKNFFILMLGLTFSSVTFSQTCDIQTPGIEAIPFTIAVGQISDLRFTVFNNANGGSCQYPAQSVMVVISLPSNGLAYHSMITPANGVGAFFDWVYDSVNKVLVGINRIPLADGHGEANVTMRVTGTTLPSYPVNRTITVNILQNPNGPIFPSNNPSNDNGQTVITISAPLPIELITFDAKNSECGTVELSWQTASERNNDYMEIQRSVDGRTFTSVAKINGTNKTEGDIYRYTDDKDLLEGSTYLYRINQVDMDGSSALYKIISVKNNCPESDLTLSLYPNPAFDKINVTLNGNSDRENVTLEIINAVGDQIMTIQSASVTTPNEIKLNNLPAGVYSVRVAGMDTVTTKRFIKIN